MFNVDDFFVIMKFYDDNKNVIGTETPLPPDSTATIIYTDETKNLDPVIIQTAIDSKQKTVAYFQNVIDIIPFNTPDYNRLRRLIIDWHATNKTFIQMNRGSSNPFSMNLDLLNEAIKSFGFDYSYFIKDKSTRALFLLSLVDLYKIKGSPYCLSDALKFFGFSNTALYEWWLVKENIDSTGQLFFEGRLINTEEDYLTQYPEKRYISWDTFEELKDSHWFYTKDQILNLDNSPQRFLGLPSLTPYFSVTNLQDVDKANTVSAILARLLSDQWNNFITESGQPPQDILIDSGGFYLSLLELYLGILYSYWRYNDWVKYSALHTFITKEFEIIPEQDYLPFVYVQPYAYERLLYWCSIRKDEFGNRQPLDITNSNPFNTSELHPISGNGFNLYLPQMEYWTAGNQPTLDGNDDLSFNYDDSVIDYDDSIFYSLLNNLPQFPLNLKYLHSNDPNIPNYDKDFNEIIGFHDKLEDSMKEFLSVTSRPTSRTDAKNKLTQYAQDFTRLQQLNFTLNQKDPQRILDGIAPVDTSSELIITGVTVGTTCLVRHGPGNDPTVYIYTGSDWDVLPDGLINGELGLNPTFKAWIDSQTGSDQYNYIKVAEDLTDELDVFVSTYLQQTQIRLTLLLLGMDVKTELGPIIDFFKPAKARFLTFEILYKFDQPLENSVNIDDFVDASEININLPEEMPETLRGGFPENYDDYLNDYDSNEIFDNVDITVYEDDGFGNMILVPQEDWANV